MSKNRYAFVLSRDWERTFGDILSTGDEPMSGEFQYRTNHTAQHPRLTWTIYYDREERSYLVMKLVDVRGETLHWHSLPMPITRSQQDWLSALDGHDITIQFLGTRRVSSKFELICTLALHRAAVLGETSTISTVLAKADSHVNYMLELTKYFEQYLTTQSAEVSIMQAVNPYPLTQWEY